MSNIYFVRHAQPNFNNHDEVNRELSDKGLKDREKIVNFFSNIKIDKIYFSPYKRTIDTIKLCSIDKNLKIILIDDFRERKIGEWVENFNEFSIKQWEDFNYKLENGESLLQVQKRNIQALKNLINNDYNYNIIISGHGTSISTIINYFDKKFDINEFNKIKNKMPFILKFEFNDLGKFLNYKFIDLED